MNCVDPKLVQESGVVSITSANRRLADEPEYSNQQSQANNATIRSTISGALEETYGSIKSGQPKTRKEENDTVSASLYALTNYCFSLTLRTGPSHPLRPSAQPTTWRAWSSSSRSSP